MPGVRRLTQATRPKSVRANATQSVVATKSVRSEFDLAQSARLYAPSVLDRLHAIATRSQSPSAAVKAAEAILDRAYGKAPQKVEVHKVVAQLDVAQLAVVCERILARREEEGRLPPTPTTAEGGIGVLKGSPPKKLPEPSQLQSTQYIDSPVTVDAEFAVTETLVAETPKRKRGRPKKEVDTQSKKKRQPRKRKRKPS